MLVLVAHGLAGEHFLGQFLAYARVDEVQAGVAAGGEVVPSSGLKIVVGLGAAGAKDVHVVVVVVVDAGGGVLVDGGDGV